MKTVEKKAIVYKDGFSEAAWKSLAVKAQRMGWPEGLRQAAKRLSPSTMKSLLIGGLAEDTFPTREELAEAVREINERDYDSLCARETHHGRGYTPAFCDMEAEAMKAERTQKGYIWASLKEILPGLWIPTFRMNCWWTWLQIEPQDAGATREIDEAEWTAMPAAMADMHCPEGKQRGTITTVLSGSYPQHRILGRRVMEEGGWEGIRREVHSDILPAAEVEEREPIEAQAGFRWEA